MTQLDHTEPKNMMVILYLVISTFVTFFIIIALYVYFKSVMQNEIHVKVEQAPTLALDTLRQKETELIGQDIYGNVTSSYAAADAAKGIYRIPIARAMELETQQPWRNQPGALTPAAPAPAAAQPTPQPGATPAPATPPAESHATPTPQS